MKCQSNIKQKYDTNPTFSEGYNRTVHVHSFKNAYTDIYALQ